VLTLSGTVPHSGQETPGGSPARAWPQRQRMTGNQLVAPVLFKVIVSYSF
jgi:hypothetical protein